MKTQPPFTMRVYSALLHRAPVVSGLTRLSFNWLTNRAFSKCEHTIAATLKDGNSLEVDPSDYHGRILYLFGTNDPKVHHVTRAFLREGDVFLDIGANYSSIGLLASSTVGRHGNVHLFEPQPLLCERVQNAIDRSGYANVTLHRIGLLDQDGQLTLTAPKHHSGMATFVWREQCTNWDASQMCEVRNIASYVRPLTEDRPFGAKIDIEGAEPKVLPWPLAQPMLRFLVFEAAHNQQQMWNDIRKSGMVLYGLRRHPFRKQLIRVDEFSQLSAFHDLVAIRIPDGSKRPRKVNPYRLAKQLEQEKAC